MCEAGRIRHHLKHNLWNKNNTIVFVGYQVDGTLGRTLLDGAKSVKLFGEYVSVKAEIVQMQGTSSHADMNGLLEWANAFENKPKRLFVTHGEDKVAEYFANKLFETQRQRSLAPYNGAEWDLINDECIFEGNKNLIKNGDFSLRFHEGCGMIELS
jgi:metallo-beta-lactamase family protein